jgi:FHS family L-fucose permease-like MFS transporter
MKSERGALAILTVLFFAWGFMTSLNDVLIPHLKAVFTLNYAQAMLVQFCFFMAYFIFSLPSGYMVEKIGYQSGIVLGLAIASIGCFLFYPAAVLGAYWIFLMAFFILALGITALQVAANPYVTMLGAPNSASSRLTLTQAFNALGTTIAPYFGALFILNDEPYRVDETLTTFINPVASIQDVYLIIAATFLCMAFMFRWLRLPLIQPVLMQNDASAMKSTWLQTRLVMGALAIFLYVGAEVAIGSFLINFLGEPTIAALSVKEAATYVPFYWGGAMLGRFIGAWTLQKVPPHRVLIGVALMAAGLVSVTILETGYMAMWSILAVGLFNSVMFPTIVSLALENLGPYTGRGSGILCMAIAGGALLPVLQGFLADQIGIQKAFVVPLCCYFYIVSYGFFVHIKTSVSSGLIKN